MPRVTPAPSTPPPTPQLNTMAAVAFALSVLGIFVLPSALGGVVCGHLARRQIRRTGEQGDAWALAALILGYLLLLLSIAGLLLFGGFMITMFGVMAFM
ncbi:DUF4190 domain-containing protein [Chromohalobacter sp. TMW 2.2308]|uniref:DUF4190 domain-containing protein n=1 Tax=Chromohalobacter TaxID=42054 RepID=UPI00045C3E3F|nr:MULTISPECIES: DUF4190 domain-containing protein [Chromohalobacter]MCK2041492.1 DUF4190 domain-containing protein [Chromohalobacter moromii]MCT8513640.1 DUF4190 domain-containing protein [Chromohalobacter sp. TMW 2.2271]CDQ33542.1 hypothetical protein BN993_02986 [Virgibacillus halodenitrificans]